MDLLTEESPQSTGRIRVMAARPIESSKCSTQPVELSRKLRLRRRRRGFPTKRNMAIAHDASRSAKAAAPVAACAFILSISRGASSLYKSTNASAAKPDYRAFAWSNRSLTNRAIFLSSPIVRGKEARRCQRFLPIPSLDRENNPPASQLRLRLRDRRKNGAGQEDWQSRLADMQS